jgi:hypothetical protein
MIAINCTTKEEFKKVLEKFEEMGRVWFDGEKPMEGLDRWDEYEEETCLIDEDDFGYSYINYFKKEGREIISASEYLNEWKQGDILVDKDGREKKILGICGEVYFMSFFGNFENYGTVWTKKELEKNGCKLKTDLPENEVEKAIKLLEEKGKIVNGKIIK